jgi:hypothetical protein
LTQQGLISPIRFAETVLNSPSLLAPVPRSVWAGPIVPFPPIGPWFFVVPALAIALSVIWARPVIVAVSWIFAVARVIVLSRGYAGPADDHARGERYKCELFRPSLQKYIPLPISSA